MNIQEKPDYLIFAESAKKGEVSDFPDVSRGWGITIEQTGSKPPMEWMNGAFNRVDKNMLYLLQQGVPEWNESVKYPANAIIKYNGVLYTAIVENDNAKPSTNTTKWTTVIENKYLPANKINNKKYEVAIETNFKQRPKFNDNDILSVNDFGGMLNENGYQKLPSGLIIQWGVANSSYIRGEVIPPVAFPNRVLSVHFTDTNSEQATNSTSISWRYESTTVNRLTWSANEPPGLFSFFAIGY
ncbi:MULTISPECIES: gp53-like domain-containing protein [unclassified Gilliamella]|uniref:gp53-like domain-containing protein n=1 Tax=unclassified Gilliamella TaxID=2685620 RepID=UPI0013245652|nr:MULTISPECIES: hypothetical protein [unclassified Gilliamella]MWN31026.1 hypothetical protein [Gilliamella sp. Pra-s60]MWP28409.1 hypothetical protein [Gilliamella sp. Pra-s54]